MHKSSKCLEKYAGVILFRPEYAGVSSGVEKIAPDVCRSKKSTPAGILFGHLR